MFKYGVLYNSYMNVRFRRLNTQPAKKASSSLQLPHQVIIDDWLRRDRQRRQQEQDDKRPRKEIPTRSPEQPKEAPVEEPTEIRINIITPDSDSN